MQKEQIAAAIGAGDTFLGSEFGSTRIKAVLTDLAHQPIASGSFDWENSLIDGIWTYSLDEIHQGLQQCFADLKKNVQETYGTSLKSVKSMGVSAMMHGFLVFDKDGHLLTPFRTWRNTITGEAAAALSERFRFNIPERWSIAHLYQVILNGEQYVPEIAYMTTLAGYIHFLLTGEKVLGVGDACGMFPIDSATGDYNKQFMASFETLISDKNFPWRLQDILPRVLFAGDAAGTLTAEGALLLDPTGDFQSGVPLCPPEGDAGTGMVATNSVAVNTGNVSAGTSIFAMAVLEKELSRYYPEIDMVTTPDGKPVAMVHCNNCTGDLDGWMRLFAEVLERFGVSPKKAALYDTLLLASFDGDEQCGGLMNYNYLSGESITGLTRGKPMFLREQNSRFTLPNFMKTQLFSCLATLRIGMNILYSEGVSLSAIAGHGGYYKTKETGARYTAAALKTPVTIMETAGEGGPWGIAVLAGFAAMRKEGESLSAYLDAHVFANAKKETVNPTAEDMACFDDFLARYQSWLPAQKAAALLE